jgi:hypothetical protein
MQAATLPQEVVVQYFNALFQELPAEEKDVIRILAPYCYENNVDITNVDITKPSNEKAIAMATSCLFQDREFFNRGIVQISDTRGHDWDLLMKLFSSMKWWQRECILFCLDREARITEEEQRIALCSHLTKAYVQDREQFLQVLYNDYAEEAEWDLALRTIFANVPFETNQKISFMVDCATDRQDFPDHVGMQLTKLYIENRPGFEAKYKSKKSHAKMVGRMKQTCKHCNEDCKFSMKWSYAAFKLVSHANSAK